MKTIKITLSLRELARMIDLLEIDLYHLGTVPKKAPKLYKLTKGLLKRLLELAPS